VSSSRFADATQLSLFDASTTQSWKELEGEERARVIVFVSSRNKEWRVLCVGAGGKLGRAPIVLALVWRRRRRRCRRLGATEERRRKTTLTIEHPPPTEERSLINLFYTLKHACIHKHPTHRLAQDGLSHPDQMSAA